MPVRGAGVSGTPYELLERGAIAMESLAFLAEAMVSIKAPLLHFIPKTHLTQLTEFYGSSVAMVTPFGPICKLRVFLTG